jgi:non-homologous end joining protein Ku
MAPRAHWKGYLKLSLVSCPISLYPAISAAERISFRQVNRQTGNRLRQQLVDTVTGEVVNSHDKGRGYEVAERQLLLVPDEDLEAAQQEARRRSPPAPARASPSPPAATASEPQKTVSSRREQELQLGRKRQRVEPDPEPIRAEPPAVPVRIENNRTIEIDRFVPGAQIDPCYFDTPYYVAPRDEVGQEAFAVIRDAMRGKDMVGMGRVILSKRERPIILAPLGRGLRGMTLRYAHEVRSPAEIFAAIPDLKLPDEMLDVAEHLLRSKTADFDPAFLEDRYRTALVSMLKEKQAELPRKASPAMPSPQNVINLMDALKRSLESERPPASSKPRTQRLDTAPKPAATRSRPRSGRGSKVS